MLCLSEFALRHAVVQCRDNPRYNVYVIVAGMDTARKVSDCVENIAAEACDDFDVTIKLCHNIDWALFKNGSTIGVIPVSNNIRGYRCHLAIVEDIIQDRLIESDITVRQQASMMEISEQKG